MIEAYCMYNFPPPLMGRVRDLRVLWTLEELGLPYEIRWVNAAEKEHKAPAYRALNPFGKIPAMRDGGKPIFESGAILQHLAEKTGKLGGAPGTDEPSLVRQWTFAALNTVEAPFLEIVASDLFWQEVPGIKERRAMAADAAKSRLADLEPVLAKNDFVAGSFSIADILLTHTLSFAQDDALFESAPVSAAYVARMKRRPAFTRAAAAQGRGPN